MLCHLCNSKKLETLYEGPIRSGGADSGIIDGYQVYQCKECGIAFLDPFPDDIYDVYTDETYWKERLGEIEIGKLQKKLDKEQLRWLFEIGMEKIRVKRILDFGCGAGLFLDLVKGIALETIGVDQGKMFNSVLEANGHTCFQNMNNIKEESIDVAVSFDTLEHIPQPKKILAGIHQRLVPGGLFYVGVPNLNDFLKEIVPAYLPFFYHKSHLFYYTLDVLENLLHQAGFKTVSKIFIHKYDLMNMIIWAREGKGQGKTGSTLFDKETEDDFRLNIERQGIASHILIEAKKNSGL